MKSAAKLTIMDQVFAEAESDGDRDVSFLVGVIFSTSGVEDRAVCLNVSDTFNPSVCLSVYLSVSLCLCLTNSEQWLFTDTLVLKYYLCTWKHAHTHSLQG